ncbi:MAG: glycine cleavage system aminomethyltransferase GcvT [Candidatus Omnitrophica bacterium]|nr:glycine cleavage system aminomethyltransferase GcvT [Candidatus Omnitrophota bacterium]
MTETANLQRTGLYEAHLALGAKTTPFHGWEMPLYYTSILDEHRSVRSAAGLFDISHMGQVWVSGPDAQAMLDGLVVSDLTQVAEGRACYTMLVNEQGGILDDIIIYRVAAWDYLVIVNCGTRAKDAQWLGTHATSRASVDDISDGRAIIALQGPKSAGLMEAALELHVNPLGRFAAMPLPGWGERAWVSRTGYTGSDGFECFLPDAFARRLWTRLIEGGKAAGLSPAGLGARDTLRLEAGLRLYGTDMDETTTPFEADLGWTVALSKPAFIGKAALSRQKAQGVTRRLVGLVGQGPVPRHGCPIMLEGRDVGVVTSGTYSPMLERPIGFGMVEIAASRPETALQVTVRHRAYPATVVKPPFWRHVPAHTATT